MHRKYFSGRLEMTTTVQVVKQCAQSRPWKAMQVHRGDKCRQAQRVTRSHGSEFGKNFLLLQSRERRLVAAIRSFGCVFRPNDDATIQRSLRVFCARPCAKHGIMAVLAQPFEPGAEYHTHSQYEFLFGWRYWK